MDLQKEKNKPIPHEFKYIEVDKTKRLECPYCGRLQMYGEVNAIEVKCRGCKEYIRFKSID